MFINTFPIPPSDLVKDNAIKAREDALKQELSNRKLYYGAYLGENIAETTMAYFAPEVWKEVPPAQQNMIYRFVKRISLVYKNQPEYIYGNPEAKIMTLPPNEYDELGRWVFMKSAERKVNLMGESLIHPVVRDGKMERDFIWSYVPFYDDVNPNKLIGVMYPVGASDIDVSRDNEVTWSFWSEEEHFLFKDSKKLTDEDNPNNENPYDGMLPFATAATKERDSGLGLGYGGQLWEANATINNIFTEMGMGVRLNLLGQWVYSGSGDVAEINLGVGIVAGVSQGDDLKLIAPAADITSAVEAVRARYEDAAQNLGLMIKWAEGGEAKSGVALRIESVELLESREDDVPRWQLTDNRLYEIEQAVADNEPNFPSLPKERSVNFTEIEFPITPQERIDRDRAEIEMGLTSAAAILMRDNPDGFKTIEEAQEEVTKNQALTPKKTSGLSSF